VIVTKLDVLSAFDVVKLAVAYDYGDRRFDHFPPSQTVLNKARPVYEELPGWQEDLRGARALTDLPPPARAYLDRLEELIQTPVSWVSVGPGRDEMVRGR
jgi:adenylosuccinate synthase